MKRVALSLAAMMAISSSAMAGGDIVPVAPVPMDSWSGFYVGAEAGYIWGDADTRFDGEETISQDVDGFAGGLYAGYNWLLDNNVLIGVEGDINWVNADDKKSGDAWEVSFEENWEASLRLRLGMVIDDTWMPYITGGIAWADVDARYREIGDNTWQSASETMTGWTIGAGVEYKITENFHAKLEYRYADYGDFSNSWDNDIVPDTKTDFKSSKVYLGVSYRF